MQAEPTTGRVDGRAFVLGFAASALGRLLTDTKARARYASNLQIVVGVLLLVLGYSIGHDHCRLVLFGVRSRGKLVGYVQQSFASGSTGTFWVTASMPVIQFQAEGDSFRFRDWMGSDFRTPMGGVVPILYDPRRPATAMIDRPVWNWIPWAPTMAVGCLLLIAGTRARLRLASCA